MAQSERTRRRAQESTHRKGTPQRRDQHCPSPADTARSPEAHACQHTPSKHGPDAVRTAPAHTHRPPEPAQGKKGRPPREEGATPTEGVAENIAAQPNTTPSTPGDDSGHSKGHHTGTRRGRGHHRSTQG